MSLCVSNPRLLVFVNNSVTVCAPNAHVSCVVWLRAGVANEKTCVYGLEFQKIMGCDRTPLVNIRKGNLSLHVVEDIGKWLTTARSVMFFLLLKTVCMGQSR